MQIAYALPVKPEGNLPLVLSIGSFDGVHLGHRTLLNYATQVAHQQHMQIAVITFSNHPSSVVRPDKSTAFLCTIEHKIQLLKQANIDQLFLLPFTKELAELSAEQFLSQLQHSLAFKALIVGDDTHIGKNRHGNKNTVLEIAKKLDFSVEYFPDVTLDGERISSSRIREYLQRGDLKQAEKYLGRPYSIYSQVIKGYNRGAEFGFPTANIGVNGLCLPPLGVYAVSIKHHGHAYLGVANLGTAPTVKTDSVPMLEVHLFNFNDDLYGQYVDVRFHAYIRPEVKFSSIDELKAQISSDISTAHKLLA